MNVGNKNAQILFIDRKLVHESDSLSAYQLFASLRLRRDEVVNHFYNGVRDGLRNGVQPILLVKGLGLNTGIYSGRVYPCADFTGRYCRIGKDFRTNIRSLGGIL